MAADQAGIPVHPVLAEVSPDRPAATEASVKLDGYVGPASRDGVVRLYSSLTNLSHYVEFAEDDVVQTRDTPANVLPDEGTTIWIRARAPVQWIREYPTASAFAAGVKKVAGGA